MSVRDHYDPDGLMGRAVAKLSEFDNLTTDQYKRVLLSICETKDQASNLAQEMKVRGLIERRVVLTDRFRKAAESVRGVA